MKLKFKSLENTYTDILDWLPDSVVITGMDDLIVGYNQLFQDILGYSDHELDGFSKNDITPEKWILSERKIIEEKLQSAGQSEFYEQELIKKTGEKFPVLIKCCVEGGRDGKPLRLWRIIRDLTIFKENEEKLRLAASVFEGSSDGIIITDPYGRILDVNKAFTEITGYTREETVDKTPALFKSNRHGPEFYRNLWAELRLKGYWRGEIWDRRKNGEVFPMWETINAVKDSEGAISHYVGVFSDITTIKTAEERLHYLAHYDALTGLPNRLLFRDRLDRAMIQAGRNSNPVALMYVDLDGFKFINDSLGHRVGDQLLKEVTYRIGGCLREGDTLARLGGDEFAVVLPDLTEIDSASVVSRRIIETLSDPIDLGRHEVVVTASVGIAVYPDDAEDKDDLLKHADTAMYHAKEDGKNNYKFFTSEMNVRTIERLNLENNLRYAIEHKQFLLHYQPRVDLKTGRMIGMEALIRWQHPETGLISPARFIPVAEETGLIVPIGEWVLECACKRNKVWLDEGLAAMRVAVNLSGRQFRQPGLVEFIARTLENSGLPPHQLELEITESMVMHNVEEVIEMMHRLKDMGIHISIDDFGTGYSSLNWLKRFPIDTLKVDQSFVRDMADDSGNLDIVRAIISLGHNLNLNVLAEGVETDEQLRLLKREGCDEMQGYLFSPPLDEDKFTEILIKESKLAESDR